MSSFAGTKVLIVDDSGYMRHVIKRHLEKHGFVIAAEAVNGIEAIQMYNQIRPNVVTMDISMKKVDGIDATRKIKQIDPNAKIIILSALGEARFIKEAIAAGACDFIIKPFDEKRLLSSLTKVLRKGS